MDNEQIVNGQIRKVCVVGLGYIGLPTAVTLASAGLEVCGVDIRQHVVDELNEGRAHFSEPDLEGLLVKVVRDKALYASTKPVAADAFIIAVPTPFLEDKSGDTSYVEAATRSLAPVLRSGNLVVLESTSPVGTTEFVCRIIKEMRPDLSLPLGDAAPEIFVAYCPERILPGHMMRELIENDRIVGGMSPECAAKARSLYSTFVRGQIHEGSAPIAELVKLSENAFRDVNIAFANELSVLCRKLGLDVFEVIRLANLHPRVNILKPGTGVGGHCIAVDPWFLVAPNRRETPLMRTAREVNDAKPDVVIEDIHEVCRGIDKPVIACLGATYKPDVDDVRESPALTVVNRLADGGAEVILVEPHIKDAIPGLHEKVRRATMAKALAEADVLAILVNHTQFLPLKEADLSRFRVVDPGGTLRQ